jgi:hypothetical protein
MLVEGVLEMRWEGHSSPIDPSSPSSDPSLIQYGGEYWYDGGHFPPSMGEEVRLLLLIP